MGYTNVKVFTDGFPVWRKAGNYYAVEASYIKNIVDNMKVAVFIDSRPTRPAYVKGHLPGALSIPDKQYDTLKGILPIDKKIPLIFYCGGYT